MNRVLQQLAQENNVSDRLRNIKRKLRRKRAMRACRELTRLSQEMGLYDVELEFFEKKSDKFA